MNKKCEICGIRPAMPKGQMIQVHGVTFPYCDPCMTEANWENTHSDYGHDADGPAIADDYGATSGGKVDGCWICHPELNKASANYVQRAGTSRAGMKISVPIRASGVEKAEHVMSVLGGEFSTKLAKPTKRNGQTTTLTAQGNTHEAILKWDSAGRFLYGPSTVDAKRVRNLAGALRALGA